MNPHQLAERLREIAYDLERGRITPTSAALAAMSNGLPTGAVMFWPYGDATREEIHRTTLGTVTQGESIVYQLNRDRAAVVFPAMLAADISR
jgi:hypothetical protein